VISSRPLSFFPPIGNKLRNVMDWPQQSASKFDRPDTKSLTRQAAVLSDRLASMRDIACELFGPIGEDMHVWISVVEMSGHNSAPTALVGRLASTQAVSHVSISDSSQPTARPPKLIGLGNEPLLMWW
jgi:hypothetical protein